MDLRVLRGKRVTVLGLGVNGGGVGAARFLARAGAHVLVTDQKSADALASSLRALRGFRTITYVLGRHRLRDITSADVVIPNPAVPRDSPELTAARRHGIAIVTDLSLFLARCPSTRIIAVTGTKGKSTTAALIAAVLRRARLPVILAGNIGVAPLDVLPRITPQTWVVLELSSWQLEGIAGIRFTPAVAVLTNILRDHLDRYRSFAEYAAVKRALIVHQRSDQVAVLNTDDPRVRMAARRTSARVYSWSTAHRVALGCSLVGRWIACRSPIASSRGAGRTLQCTIGSTRILPIAEIPLPGRHNIANVLAAATTTLAIGIPPRAIRAAVREFRGIPHRLERVRIHRGVSYVNDSAATMPDAAAAAIAAFPQSIILICGGVDKTLDFTPILRALASPRVRRVVLLEHPAYTASARIRAGMVRRGLAQKLMPATSMAAAVRSAAAIAHRGDVVLCSPAAASFGMFMNEFDRGDQFRAAVRAL